MSFFDRLPFRVAVGWVVLACGLGYVLSLRATVPDHVVEEVSAFRVRLFHIEASAFATLSMLVALASVSSRRVAPILRHALLLGAGSFLPVAAAVAIPALPTLSHLRALFAVAAGASGGAALAAGWLRAREHGLTPAPFGLLAVGFIQVAGAVVLLFRMARFPPPMIELLPLAAVAALGEPAPEERPSRASMVAVALIAAALLQEWIVGPTGWGRAAHVALGGVLVALTWRGLAARLRSQLACWAARLALLLFAEATALASVVAILRPDSHLRDTTFVVGATHLEVFTVVIALIAEWLRDREARPRLRRVPFAGLVVAAFGVHLFTGSHVLLGTRGMARWSALYPPAFQALHIGSTIGATLLLAGLVLTVLAVRCSRTSPTVVALSAVFE